MVYTEAEKERILSYIFKEISGGRSLSSVLKDDGMPCDSSFDKWILERKEWATDYARAREKRAETIFEDILKIADGNSSDVTFADDVERVNHEIVQRSRLMIDARKWMLGKMQPKKYGDSIDVTSGGEKLETVRIFQLPDNGRGN